MSEPTDPGKPASSDLTGRVDKYEITGKLGKGAMGQVYKARDTVLDRHVALKVMAAQIADDVELKERFEREARAVAKMTHPNVVMVFDLGSLPDGSPYIAMEFLDGQDLQKAVRKPPPMSTERKVQIIVQVLMGLDHAHQQGIVHRDIKPANVFIQQDDTVKIMDFGVARLTSASMTGTGNIVGTADYMSPEQVQGQKVDGRSDLFSVGCLLYELVTGRRPFHADNLMAIFYKITHDGANFDLIPSGPENDALLPTLKKALSRSIDERYQTAAEFAIDLRQWLKAHGTSASSQHVLESLVDLEAPTHMPQPMTDPAGRPLADGTVDLQQPGVPGRGTPGPTQVNRPTVVEAPGRPAARPRGRPAGRPPVARRRARPAPRRSPMPLAGLAVVAVAAIGGGAYYYLTVLKPQGTTTPSTLASPPPTPAPAATVEATPAPPPVTVAPQPTFAPSVGKAAASVKAAQVAFNRGQYGRAVASAQKALGEDPSNATAQQILEKAENGQKAASRVKAGQAALSQGDFDAAEREAVAARRLAPWDTSVAELRRRIDAGRLETERAAQAQANQARTARVNELLSAGNAALAAKEYDKAIQAYDEALALDPSSTAARTGQAGAYSARSVSEAAASGGGGAAQPAHAFVMGRSVARASKADTGSAPPGFDTTPEVDVRRGSQAATLPGQLVIEVSPSAPEPGQSYQVSAYLVNEGAQPIRLERLVVTTTIDGKKRQGPVPPRASTVAPHQRAIIFQLRPQVWKQGTASWEMEIVAHTSRSDTYTNTLTWK